MLMTKGKEGEKERERDGWVGGRNQRRKGGKRESTSLCHSCCIPHRSSLSLFLPFSLSYSTSMSTKKLVEVSESR